MKLTAVNENAIYNLMVKNSIQKELVKKPKTKTEKVKVRNNPKRKGRVYND